ncbi:hypothetical protein C8Q74DRAFT_1431515, partial [Fomes fomentarius]
TVTLTGLQIPHPLTLSREEAFPARQLDILYDASRNRPDWTPDLLPENGGRFSLVLAERIGFGRSSVVYAVKTEAVVPGSGSGKSTPPRALCQDRTSQTLPHSRARGLDVRAPSGGRFTRGHAPRCYGFFVARLPHNLFPHDICINVKDDEDEDAPADSTPEDPTRDDPLPDDDNQPGCIYDASRGDGGRELSPWVDWRHDIDSQLLAVLVLARGGPTYGIEDDENPKTQKDVRQILKDLSRAYILHEDLRPPNLIRAPADTSRCPYHNRVHKWNIIDLGGTSIDDPEDNDSVERHKDIAKFQRRSYQSLFFYTGRC